MRQYISIFAGLNASGKSTLARAFEACYRGRLVHIDKDDPSLNANVDINLALGDAKEQGKNLYETDLYKTQLRPAVYKEIFEKAKAAINDEKSCIIDAPFTSEARDSNFLTTLQHELLGDKPNNLVQLSFFWFVCAPEVLKENMIKRGAERDHGKLSSDQSWCEYIERVDFGFRPSFDHVLVDTSDEQHEAVIVEQIESQMRLVHS